MQNTYDLGVKLLKCINSNNNVYFVNDQTTCKKVVQLNLLKTAHDIVSVIQTSRFNVTLIAFDRSKPLQM